MISSKYISSLLLLVVAVNFCIASDCLENKAKAEERQREGMMDIVPPKCDENGKYEKIQCFFVGCYCADGETGAIIGDVVRWGEGRPICD
ncbi:hypothetical protein B4U80_14621 [Leptotrombidium deliense]|uniref:Thyroglobulin type-1 domain-containing protein n=1 Tax=Leptotrombidium deliense TaxID=299467 RepID=A0A443RSU9_9ACAR|nr:hypothetical protein B4U80_14621 [Leptotrombidium deliense]